MNSTLGLRVKAILPRKRTAAFFAGRFFSSLSLSSVKSVVVKVDRHILPIFVSKHRVNGWILPVFVVVIFFVLPTHVHADIRLVGTTTASGTNAAYNMSLTSLAGGLGTAPNADDMVVVVNVFMGTANGNPGVGTAGYTEMADLYANDTSDANFSVSYKRMGSTPDTTVSCNPSTSATNSSVCLAYVWRGVDWTNPFDVASTTATGTNSEDANCPSITPVTPGAVVFCAGGAAATTTPSAITWPATPAGIGGRTSISTDPGNAALALGTFGYWGSGAYDPAAWAITMGTQSSNSWAALTLVLRPDRSVTRKMRLFQGFRVRVISGKAVLLQQ